MPTSRLSEDSLGDHGKLTPAGRRAADDSPGYGLGRDVAGSLEHGVA
ncbi:hypothetical protein V7793_08335 [Streptomyces sp. KLMMK]